MREYTIHLAPKKYFDAQQDCVARRQTLAEVLSAADQAELSSMWNAAYEVNGGESKLWIGGRCTSGDNRATTGDSCDRYSTWHWEASKLTFGERPRTSLYPNSYTNWEGGYPRRKSTACVQMRAPSGKWREATCGHEVADSNREGPYACQTLASPPCTPANVNTHHPNLGGCCAGLNTCFEDKPTHHHDYCPTSDPNHRISCWSIIQMCRVEPCTSV
jgi:hypothetical protein